MSADVPNEEGQVVEDLLLTDAFLIKGVVEGKFSRLAKVLDAAARDFIAVSNPVMVDLRRGEVIRTPRVHVNLSKLVLAHELVDGSGDFYQKSLSELGDEKTVRIRAFYNGSVGLEISGSVRPLAYERGSLDRNFFVMEECNVRGLDLKLSSEFDLVSQLPYAILSRSRISYLYDFNDVSV